VHEMAQINELRIN